MARPSRSRARLDFSEVLEFQQKIELTASLTDQMAEDWQTEHGKAWADQMRSTVNVSRGISRTSVSASEVIHLRDEIRQVEPGGITFGEAFWWIFLEYGTVKMQPYPFIKPAMKRIRTPARRDAAERASNLLRGRL